MMERSGRGAGSGAGVPGAGYRLAAALACLAAILAVPPASAREEARAGAEAAPAGAAQDAGAHYRALVAAAEMGDPAVDWQVLRFAYADSPEFDLLGLRTWTLQDRMFEAFQAKNWTQAIAHAQAIIAIAFIDIQAHVICDLSFRALGDEVRADHHRTIARGLIGSIHTGDGKTPATAFTVITIREEYAILNIAGLTVTRQTLVREGGHAYDALDTVDDRGNGETYYFLVDRVLAAEAAAAAPKR